MTRTTTPATRTIKPTDLKVAQVKPQKINLGPEYKPDFVPTIFDGMTETVLGNSDNDMIDVATVKHFMVDGVIRGENEKAVILACLQYEEGHRILAQAATEYSRETGEWSDKVIVRWRAKISKYSKEVMDTTYTIKSQGKGKDRQFVVEEAKAQAPKAKKSKGQSVGSTDINDGPVSPVKEKADNLAVSIHDLVATFGLAAVMEAVQREAQGKAMMTKGKTKEEMRTSPVVNAK